LSERTPLYEAENAPRYDRQQLIRRYQEDYQCRLVVLKGPLFPDSVTPFEETLFDADPGEDLHVMLSTPGGDGETAIRLVRQAQSRCNKLTVIVPDRAKSAGTLFVLGADQIYMGPTSDLGPVDPQIPLRDGTWAPAKAIVAAVGDAEDRIRNNPATYPLHAALLSDITGVLVQLARDALGRTDDQLREALAVPGRDPDEVDELAQALQDPLIGETKSHDATVSARDAESYGLPVREADPRSEQWRGIWRLWTRYAVLNVAQIYEGVRASYVVPHATPG